MKRLLFLFAVLATGFLRAADDDIVRTQTGAVPAGLRAIRAENHLGNLTLTAVADGFGWEWRLRDPDNRADRAEVDQWRLEVREANGELELKVVRPESGRNRNVRLRSDLVIRVPVTTVVGIENRFGNVQVIGPRAPVEVTARNGKAELKDIDGPVTARTSFGSLRVEKVGTAELTTQNGNLEVTGVAGDLQATASFGKLAVREVRGSAVLKGQNSSLEAVQITGDLKAATTFGSLSAERIGGKADLRNQNGRIELTGVTGPVLAVTSFGSMKVRSLGDGADLRNQNGMIEATGITGNLSAATSFGGLKIAQVGGEAKLTSRNGAIDAERVTGNLHASTSFAAIRVREIGGRADLDGQNSEITAAGVAGDLHAETSFGRMNLEGSGQRIVARNRNGAVEITARSSGLRQIEASASFAPIAVRLPGEAKPLIRATTSFGKVRSDFPVTMGETLSDSRFTADTTPLKISLRGQNSDIRIEQL